jgi:transcriptional regulator of PTS gene
MRYEENGADLLDVGGHQLLRHIRNHPGLSQADLARITKLSPSTITRRIAKLIEQGYIVENVNTDQVRKRRRGTGLELNSLWGSVIGLEITDLSVTGILMDFAGNVIQEYETHLHQRNPIDVTDAINSVLAHLQDDTHIVKHIAVASHGVIDDIHGAIISFPGEPDWQATPITQRITESTGIDCTLEMRVHAALVGELCYRRLTGGTMLYFNSGPGNGIGMPLVIDGRLVSGCIGLAGNLGHIQVVPHGRRCYCGSYGCLATVATPQALVDKANAALAQYVESTLRTRAPIKFVDIVETAGQGDKLAISLIEEAGHYLGLGFSYAINLANPELIVLGGTLATAGSLLLESIKRTARQATVAAAFNCIKWEISSLQWNPAAYGAANMALERLLALEHPAGIHC